MKSTPAYFEHVRISAADRWDQLDKDPDLAGPWHQLFKQVQSPRHVLSELLQNADDAGATEAWVQISDGKFVFQHNGMDFTEEEFRSLCRFGYSNKRSLHTIGFRGIGFKSVFSLGDSVQVISHTLSISFHRQRFTEPRWDNSIANETTGTRIEVTIGDDNRLKEVKKNLEEWQRTPVSLLFFKHIRRLKIGDHDLFWASLGPGPIANTEWMAMHSNPDNVFLVGSSDAEEFPAEALGEIRQERMLSQSEDVAFPPCRVELVLGAPGRLYVVLPTGVDVKLPFACNAPFIQDPARLKIKDPEISPTNRWLLRRIGRLAASLMVDWLKQPKEDLEARCGSYGLVPDFVNDEHTLEGTCATAVTEAFFEVAKKNDFLLAADGTLKPAGQCVAIPSDLQDVWPAGQAGPFFDPAQRIELSEHISLKDQQKLMRWKLVESVDKYQILATLRSKHLPMPDSWSGLLTFWAYVAPQIRSYWFNSSEYKSLCVLPVQGKDSLYAATELVRLGEKRLLQSETDWDFLSNYLLVLNQNWLRYLADQRRVAEDEGIEGLKGRVLAAYSLLNAVELEDPSDVSKVINTVAANFFAAESLELPDCIRLAHIAARLGASAGDAFKYVTRDAHLHPPNHVVLCDLDGTLECLLSPKWSESHTLHQEYGKAFSVCTAEEWSLWVISGRAGLHRFVPLSKVNQQLWRKEAVATELQRRGCEEQITLRYQTDRFLIEDWDFDKSVWSYWSAISAKQPDLWGRLLQRMLAEPKSYSTENKCAKALHVATTRNTKPLVDQQITPEWILKFRELACLPDSNGIYRRPGELLLRTPETEPLLEIELFVQRRLLTFN